MPRLLFAAILAVALQLPWAAPCYGHGGTVFVAEVVDLQAAAVSHHQELIVQFEAAGTLWARYLKGRGTIQGRIIVTQATEWAAAASADSVFVENDDGIAIYEQGAAYEIRTGMDPNGPAPDVEMVINPRLINELLWFDPMPESRALPVPADKVDALSVFLHELGHALAYNGWRQAPTGVSPGPYQSTFDRHIVFEEDHPYFEGDDAEDVYGDPVPLTADDLHHLGNPPAAGLPGADLAAALMNGVTYLRGHRYYIGALDLAILKDCGLPVSRYGRWMLDYFTEEENADPLRVGERGDFDWDGDENLVEYALGLDPRHGGSSSVDVSVLNDGSLRITFPMRRDFDLRYRIQRSFDLRDWETIRFLRMEDDDDDHGDDDDDDDDDWGDGDDDDDEGEGEDGGCDGDDHHHRECEHGAAPVLAYTTIIQRPADQTHVYARVLVESGFDGNLPPAPIMARGDKSLDGGGKIVIGPKPIAR
ncbi:MAG: hypothetical protein R3F11_15890 [Verrucomicrobiales bacterium]